MHSSSSFDFSCSAWLEDDRRKRQRRVEINTSHGWMDRLKSSQTIEIHHLDSGSTSDSVRNGNSNVNSRASANSSWVSPGFSLNYCYTDSNFGALTSSSSTSSLATLRSPLSVAFPSPLSTSHRVSSCQVSASPCHSFGLHHSINVSPIMFQHLRSSTCAKIAKPQNHLMNSECSPPHTTVANVKTGSCVSDLRTYQSDTGAPGHKKECATSPYQVVVVVRKTPLQLTAPQAQGVRHRVKADFGLISKKSLTVNDRSHDFTEAQKKTDTEGQVDSHAASESSRGGASSGISAEKMPVIHTCSQAGGFMLQTSLIDRRASLASTSASTPAMHHFSTDWDAIPCDQERECRSISHFRLDDYNSAASPCVEQHHSIRTRDVYKGRIAKGVESTRTAGCPRQQRQEIVLTRNPQIQSTISRVPFNACISDACSGDHLSCRLLSTGIQQTVPQHNKQEKKKCLSPSSVGLPRLMRPRWHYDEGQDAIQEFVLSPWAHTTRSSVRTKYSQQEQGVSHHNTVRMGQSMNVSAMSHPEHHLLNKRIVSRSGIESIAKEGKTQLCNLSVAKTKQSVDKVSTAAAMGVYRNSNLQLDARGVVKQSAPRHVRHQQGQQISRSCSKTYSTHPPDSHWRFHHPQHGSRISSQCFVKTTAEDGSGAEVWLCFERGDWDPFFWTTYWVSHLASNFMRLACVSDPIAEQATYHTITMLRQCLYPPSDILQCVALALCQIRRAASRIVVRDSTEAGYVLCLQLFLAHVWLLDETCPIKEWHKNIFVHFCSFQSLNKAMMCLLEAQGSLRVEPELVHAAVHDLLGLQ